MIARLSIGVPLAALLALAGCAGQDRPAGLEPGARVIDRGPPPPYEEVASVYNSRADQLGRIRSYSTVRLWYTDEQGREQQEQVEALLMLSQPRRMFLRIDKISDDQALLGSDETRYWWIDLSERKAWIGTHALASPDRLAEFALPVHPLDFIEMLGVRPLPASAASEPRWSEDGRFLVVDAPAHAGSRRLWLDPGEGESPVFEPARIQLFDRSGAPVLTAELLKYASPQEVGVRVPTEYLFEVEGTDTVIRMRPKYHAPRRIPEQVFDLERQLARYRIGAESRISLDDARLSSAP